MPGLDGRWGVPTRPGTEPQQPEWLSAAGCWARGSGLELCQLQVRCPWKPRPRELGSNITGAHAAQWVHGVSVPESGGQWEG